ncbi:MAG TPA: hypothetical protein VGV61_13110 [Thermoanaerobaculia bacterium]|nr:hypothetical protein [Thermoanaerobaculia bacterium]
MTTSRRLLIALLCGVLVPAAAARAAATPPATSRDASDPGGLEKAIAAHPGDAAPYLQLAAALGAGGREWMGAHPAQLTDLAAALGTPVR